MTTKPEESQQPQNTALSQSRRSALKKMLVGTCTVAGAAALPNKWDKPIVDKVLVPAHAQTSDSCEYSITCHFETEGEGDELVASLIVQAERECPDDRPEVDLNGVMVVITTLNSTLPSDWPCPGTKSVPLDAAGRHSEQVYPCGEGVNERRDLQSLFVQVEFQDKDRWGMHSSTCDLHFV